MIKVPPRVFTDEELGQLKMPALVLVGRQEFLYNARAAVDRAKRVLPNGKAELLPECNHAIVSDQTESVRGRLLEFLKE